MKCHGWAPILMASEGHRMKALGCCVLLLRFSCRLAKRGCAEPRRNRIEIILNYRRMQGTIIFSCFGLLLKYVVFWYDFGTVLIRCGYDFETGNFLNSLWTRLKIIAKYSKIISKSQNHTYLKRIKMTTPIFKGIKRISENDNSKIISNVQRCLKMFLEFGFQEDPLCHKPILWRTCAKDTKKKTKCRCKMVQNSIYGFITTGICQGAERMPRLPGWQCPEDASGKIHHHCHLWTDPKHPKPSLTSRVAQALGSSCLQENKNLSPLMLQRKQKPIQLQKRTRNITRSCNFHASSKKVKSDPIHRETLVVPKVIELRRVGYI